MTPRERWMCLLAGQKPDRIPTDYSATEEVTKRLLSELKCSDVYEMYDRLHIDGQRHITARSKQTCHPNDSQADMWGIRYQRVSYGPGSYDEAVYHPLANMNTVSEIDQFIWPDPDAVDYDAFAAEIKQADGRRAITSGVYEPFLLYCRMRGLEQSMMDLLVEPEIAHCILGHIFDWHYRVAERMFEIGHGRIDITDISEDLGSQTGLLFGLEQIKTFLLPLQKKMGDLARSHGIHIFYHSDGSIREVIPLLLSVTGIEILNPIQWRCEGMERRQLVADFGGKVIFHGAMDNQQTMPFGSVDDVRKEVLENIEIFGKTKWVCAPCHNLQPNTPTENILAMYEMIHENGRLD